MLKFYLILVDKISVTLQQKIDRRILVSSYHIHYAGKSFEHHSIILVLLNIDCILSETNWLLLMKIADMFNRTYEELLVFIILPSFVGMQYPQRMVQRRPFNLIIKISIVFKHRHSKLKVPWNELAAQLQKQIKSTSKQLLQLANI